MKSLISEVTEYKNMLLNIIGNRYGDVFNKSYPFISDEEYARMRKSLLQKDEIRVILPECVLACRSTQDFEDFLFENLRRGDDMHYIARSYLRVEFQELLRYLENEEFDLVDKETLSILNELEGASYIRETWRKALQLRESNPEDAITFARTLVEEVCKFILHDGDVGEYDRDDLPELFRKVKKVLNFAPNGKSEKDFIKTMQGCTTVLQGLGNVRNKESGSHGLNPNEAKPSKRHASLAVNLAGTMAEFLFATWKETQYNWSMLNSKYYNLIVTFDKNLEEGYLDIDKDRILKESEGTTKELLKYAAFNAEAIGAIKTFPSLFANENDVFGSAGVNQEAFVGVIKEIEVRSGVIRIHFESIYSISQQQVVNLYDELDITGYGLNRIHWAIKNVDLIKTLKNSGVKLTTIKNKQV